MRWSTRAFARSVVSAAALALITSATPAAPALPTIPTSTTSTATVAEPVPRRIVSGWVRPAPHMPSALATVEANADLWRDASPFWYRASGTATITGSGVDPAVIPKLKSLGVTVLPSVTQSHDTPGMIAVLADPTKRAAHVKALVGLVTSNGFDGIDLDYESMNFGGTATQRARLAQLYVTFATQLDKALAAKGKLLSITVGPRRSAIDPNWAVHDYRGLGAVADRFRIMAYDRHWRGGPAGPVAPLPWVREVVTYAVTAVPARKIQLGVPLYGYDWPRNPDGTWGTATSVSTFADADALRRSVGATRRWSTSAAAPYFTYRRDGVDHTVWYNDAYSTKAKMRLVGEFGLQGLVFWHVSGTDARQWPALRSYATPQRRDLTIAAPKSVVYGATATVSGTLRTTAGTPLAGTRVALQHHRAGTTTWRTVAAAPTASDGTVRLAFAPQATGDVRLHAAATWTYLSTVSPTVRLPVRWRVTARFADADVPAGTAVRLSGAVTPVRAGTPVERQRLIGGVWRTVATTTVATDGSYAFAWRHSAPNTYTFRVLIRGSGGLVTTATSRRTLVVR